MAEEKKPKIDLKARLGKTNLGGATPAPPTGLPVPVAPPGAASNNAISVGTPSSSPRPPGAGLPVPPGIPVGPPPAMGRPTPGLALDPSNPLAAAIAQRAPASQAPRQAAAQPQRIEVDEMAVQVARKGAFKGGLIAGLVAALVLGAVGFIAGGANETSKGRATSVGHAKALAADIQKSRDQLKTIADKTDAARNTLLKDRKFPDTLSRDLGGINVDFDGGKLAGVRFSGFSQETASGLIEFITAVQTLNDRKNATVNLLSRLQKPITESLSGGQKVSIGYVVLVGGPKDPAGNPFAVLAALQKPIEVPDPAHVSIPTEFTATNPITGGNVTAPSYKSGPIEKPAAMYVVPKSVSAACPSETTGQVAQLGGQLGHLVNDIRGDTPVPGEIQDPKPGLLERADKLIAQLNKVQ